jgi:hypothetical protein
MDKRLFFLQELEATEERYIEKKLIAGRYKDWEQAIARKWLSERKQSKAKPIEIYQVVIGVASLLIAISSLLIQMMRSSGV